MLTEKVEYKIDNINVTNKTISIVKVTLICRDGVEIARQQHRCGFVPGEIDLVAEYLGVDTSPEIDYLNAVWTEEVIQAYNESLQNGV